MTMAKVAVTIPLDILRSAKDEVRASGAASLSAFVAQAIDEKLRRDDLAKVLDAMDAERGKPGKVVRAWAKSVLLRSS